MFNLYTRAKIKRELKELQELRPLPMGRKEFEIWSRRIIRIADVPGLTIESAQFALSEMLLHVKPTVCFESDGYFVNCLRKGAVNEVAHAVFQELKKARIEKAKQEQPVKLVGEVPTQGINPSGKKVLEHHPI